LAEYLNQHASTWVTNSSNADWLSVFAQTDPALGTKGIAPASSAWRPDPPETRGFRSRAAYALFVGIALGF